MKRFSLIGDETDVVESIRIWNYFGGDVMTTVELTIQGMHCSACSERIVRRLSSAPGVASAKVDLESTVGEFTFDETKIDIAEIKRIIEMLGFVAIDKG